ncbi:MAG: hypothetical protein IJD28_06315 [Deferribacterales bacterium]|nr:hypothetical protein [Deferribacterales bacterium]
MTRRIITFVFSAMLLWSCGSSHEDAVSQYREPDSIPKIEGLTVFSLGTTAVLPYRGSSYLSLVYYIPPYVEDASESRYSMSTTGFESWDASSESGALTASDTLRDPLLKTVGEVEEDFHLQLRLKAAELLASGYSQAKPELMKGLAAYSVGDIWRNVNIGQDDRVIDAECIGISPHAYFFIETGVEKPSANILQDMMDGFEDIYSVMHEKFGVENDVDGNGKVIIMLYRGQRKDLCGYFDPMDKFSAVDVPLSNEADIFYVNDIYIELDFNIVMATLAHEFQHMISIDNRHNMGLDYLDVWIEEGLAMQAEHFTGYFFKQKADYLGYYFGNYGDTNLLHWTSSVTNYAYSYLFLRYLVEQFGDNVIKRLYNSSKTGTDAVEEAAGKPFNTIFEDFVLALFLSGKGITDDSRYNFKTVDIQGKGGFAPYFKLNSGQKVDSPILPYSFQIIEWNGTVTEAALQGNVRGYGLPKE